MNTTSYELQMWLNGSCHTRGGRDESGQNVSQQQHRSRFSSLQQPTSAAAGCTRTVWSWLWSRNSFSKASMMKFKDLVLACLHQLLIPIKADVSSRKIWRVSDFWSSSVNVENIIFSVSLQVSFWSLFSLVELPGGFLGHLLFRCGSWWMTDSSLVGSECDNTPSLAPTGFVPIYIPFLNTEGPFYPEVLYFSDDLQNFRPNISAAVG